MEKENLYFEKKANSERVTKSKKALFDLFSNNDVLSMEQIQRILRGKMNQSTIYRNINKFVEEGYIKKIIIDDVNHYTKNGDEHTHYIVCKDCHKKTQIDFCPLEKISSELQDFTITNHQFELIGICDECKNKN